MLRTNASNLVMLSVQGQITPPMQRTAYRVDREGVPFVLPGTGGIAYNVKVGQPAFGWVGDHVEPGVSTAASIDDRGGARNQAYNTLACVGNEAVVISGDAKGARGVVTGKHGGIEHVLIDFAQEDLEKMVIEDKVLIKAYGLGLELLDYPGHHRTQFGSKPVGEAGHHRGRGPAHRSGGGEDPGQAHGFRDWCFHNGLRRLRHHHH